MDCHPHWSLVGDPRAKDSVVMAWALEDGHVLFTHDLEFGTLLALTRANGPSVIQVRAQDVRFDDGRSASNREMGLLTPDAGGGCRTSNAPPARTHGRHL
jgi:predicted nuclease of predicted toxin-antitoxin system